ncbi:MAG TPA: hypothetical protein VLZ75_09730 [Chitinophagales bacterium]|nr:hypothetical protein [Chitinophagales bacterium]
MKKLCYILLITLSIIGCNQSPSEIEKDYIKNLEEKNKILEKELMEIKSKSEPTKTSKKSENFTDYFVIGSTEDKVLEVMGQPTSYIETAPEARRFYYDLSSVYFYQGKVISYDNLSNNLKARVK